LVSSECHDCGSVSALAVRLSRLARLEVDRSERPHERRQRLHGRAHDDLLAVGDTRLDPTRAIRLAVEAARLVALDLVVRLRPTLARELEPVADLYAFHGLRPHQRRA